MPRTAPHINPIKLIRNLWIPMSDGTKLAARLWLPENADTNPVPAIIEYIP
jgi:predicted acyl esterase